MINIPSTADKLFNIRDYSKIVIFFYPKDNTPGCTSECKDFAKFYTEFKALDFEVCGISRDSLDQHKKFSEKLNLPYQLLYDETNKVCKIFQVLRGKKTGDGVSIERSTFVLEEGNILMQWRKIKVKDHVEEVLKFCQNYKTE